MSDTKELTLGQLQQQIQSLSSIVEKQSQLIGKTGQQLMEIQLKDVKSKMHADDKKGSTGPGANVDMDDYATNEDIVQLVEELQGQLDLLEDRNIKRTFNSHLSRDNKAAVISPVFNRDGDEPPQDSYPKTISDFLNLTKFDIVHLCEFYELVIPADQQAQLNEFLEKNSEVVDMEDTKKLLATGVDNTNLEERVKAYSEQQIDELADELARFIGLRIRRNEANW